MRDEERLTAVREYLKSEFPSCRIEDWPDSAREGHSFRVVGEDGASHYAIVTDEFLFAFEVPAISDSLRRFTLAEHLRYMGATPVMVTTGGLKLEYE